VLVARKTKHIPPSLPCTQTHEKTHLIVVTVKLGHLSLLDFIARVDHQPAWIVFGQRHGHKGVPKATGAAGDKDGFIYIICIY
jgi:hypothetical protein